MKKSDKIAPGALEKIKASSTSTPTPAGQTISSNDTAVNASPGTQTPTDDSIAAINQMFAELELAYHNQYNKAYPSAEKLQLAKKLWYDYLKEYSPIQILKATRNTIRDSEYLPTVHTLLKYIEDETESLGLPKARAAYQEVCRSSHPRIEHRWSHPAVYHAGRQTGWFTIDNEEERVSWPLFQEHYRIICKAVANGTVFDMPENTALPSPEKALIDPEEAIAIIDAFQQENR